MSNKVLKDLRNQIKAKSQKCAELAQQLTTKQEEVKNTEIEKELEKSVVSK